MRVLTQVASQSRPEGSEFVQWRAFRDNVEMRMDQELTEYTGNLSDDFRRVSYYFISIYAIINSYV